MPNTNSKDLLILQKLNKEITHKRNNQHTLLHVLKTMLRIVLLIVLYYGVLILFMLLKGGTW